MWIAMSRWMTRPLIRSTGRKRLLVSGVGAGYCWLSTAITVL